VATGSQRAKVQLLHVQQGDARDVAEGFSDAVVATVDDAGSRPHDSPPVAHFSLSGAESFAVADFLHVLPGLDLAQQRDGFFRLLEGLDLIVDDQRHFRDLLNLVAL